MLPLLSSSQGLTKSKARRVLGYVCALDNLAVSEHQSIGFESINALLWHPSRPLRPLPDHAVSCAGSCLTVSISVHVHQISEFRSTYGILGNCFHKHHTTSQTFVSCDSAVHEFLNVLGLDFLVCASYEVSSWELFALSADCKCLVAFFEFAKTYIVTPTTPASATAGWSRSSASSSAGAT
jgi:hypothetical protein